jgi:hypothetical protein
MRSSTLGSLALSALLGATAGCTAPDASSHGSPLLGAWGSTQAGLAVSDSGATLKVLASGGCYGSYGHFAAPATAEAFDVTGTYTLLTGAYPGKVQYAARFSGSLAGDQLTLTVAVPSLGGAIGPFVLTRGVTGSWNACLYPAEPGAGS